ncbi:restriction endonuclease subunit S [Limosilactobacillus agrestis]|uniref:restriction endonuclease subunit S n=1 Tax=Limosilactobacillus agrestis TaxID=2759748 RepID=UPI002872B178|nr:restriction endonuclease subunit S [Limosilactobacillus agrestis]
MNKGWEQRKLGDVAKVTMGQSPSSKNYTDNPNDYVLVQGNADLKSNEISPRVWTKEVTKQVHKGEFIMTVRAPVGYLAMANMDAVIGRGVAAIDGNKYLYYLLQTKLLDRTWEKLSSGSTFESISSNDIKNLEIKVTETEEEKLIAKLMDTVTYFVTLQQRKLKQLKQLKTAMLQQLFVSKNSKQPVLRFENFDSDWRQHSLEDISAKIYSGLTGKSKDDFGHGKARYITYLNVHNNEVAVSDGVEQIEVDSKQNKVLKGDLLFTISSEVPSEVALNSVWSSEAGTDIYLNSFCFGIRPKSNYVNSFFLTYYLRSPQMRKLIYPLAQGISRFNISKRSILALKINTPVLPE